MVIEPRAISFGLTEPLRAYVESRVQNALEHHGSGVLRVEVRMADVNGDHGGADKRCNIVAALRRRRVIVAEATCCSLYSAIDAAAAKIGRSVQRVLARHVWHERKGPRRHPRIDAESSSNGAHSNHFSKGGAT